MFNGDWQNAGYDKDLPGNVGFFLFPPAEAGGSLAAMSAPLTYGIASQREERRLRRILLQLGRHERDGPPDRRHRRRLEPRRADGLPVPPATAGSVTNETLAAGADVAKDNGAMDFIANATSSIFAQGWTPELQKMVGGKQDAAGLLKAVQAEYAKELSR